MGEEKGRGRFRSFPEVVVVRRITPRAEGERSEPVADAPLPSSPPPTQSSEDAAANAARRRIVRPQEPERYPTQPAAPPPLAARKARPTAPPVTIITPRDLHSEALATPLSPREAETEKRALLEAAAEARAAEERARSLREAGEKARALREAEERGRLLRLAEANARAQRLLEAQREEDARREADRRAARAAAAEARSEEARPAAPAPRHYWLALVDGGDGLREVVVAAADLVAAAARLASVGEVLRLEPVVNP